MTGSRPTPAGPAPPAPSGRVPLPLLGLVVVLAAAVYLPSLRNDFAYDDVQIVEQDSTLHDLSRLPQRIAEPYWPNRFGRALGLWRPVTTAALSLQWAAWDGEPAGFHATNLLLHASVALLVTLVLAHLLSVAGAVAGGIVFALHPVHVEAVANVVGVAELLSAAFFLGACLVFLRRRRRLDGPAVGGITLLYLLALLSKEGAVVLPGVLLVLDLGLERTRLRETASYLRRRWGLYAALGAAAVAVLGTRYLVLGSVANPSAPLGADILRRIPRIWTVASVWPEYLRLFLVPADLSADYSPLVLRVHHGWSFEVAAGVLLALSVLLGALWVWRRHPRLAGPPVLALLWFVVTILPVANVFFLSGILLAERTLYLPSVALALAVGWVAAQLVPLRLLGRGRQAAAGALLAIALAGWAAWLGVRTWSYVPVWRSTVTVFLDLLERHPESGRVHWRWGVNLAERGRDDEALDHFRLATRILGTETYYMMADIGRALLNVDRLPEAEHYLRYAVNDAPDIPDAHEFLAVIYQRQGRWSDAERSAREAIELGHPTEAMYHIVAAALEEQGRWSEAVRYRRAALDAALSPDWRRWIWLAGTQREAGRWDDACASLAEAARRAPGPEARRVVDSLRTVVAETPSAPACAPAPP